MKFIHILSSVIILSLILGACGRDTPTPTEGGEVSDIRVEMAEAEKAIVGTEEIPLPNCGGDSDLKVSFASETKVTKAVAVGAKATTSAGGEVAIPEVVKLTLEVQVELAYQQTYEVESSRLYQIDMTVKPGSSVVYVIEWEEQTFASTVSYAMGGEAYKAPYQYVLGVPRLSDSFKRPCPTWTSGATATPVPPTPTPIPPTATPVVTALVPDADLSVHYWTSRGGGNSFLDESLYPFRAGVSHIEDLPVAGQSITLLTFDTSALRGRNIVNAWLDLSRFDVIGDPFGAFDGLIVEEVSYANFGFDVINSPSRREVSRLSGAVSELDVTQAVKEAIERGSTRFQLRLRCADVVIADELTQPDDYVEWDVIRLVIESQ